MIKGTDDNLTVYFQPVATVMSLFRRYQGEYAVYTQSEGAIDVVASRTDNIIYMHLVNTDCKNSAECKIDVGVPIKSI